MFNKVILIGRTTSDVELKYTPTNVVFNPFSLFSSPDESSNLSKREVFICLFNSFTDQFA